MSLPSLTIEVVYGTPQKQQIKSFTVAEGTTVEQCIIQSGMLSVWPEIDLKVNKVGIWNRTCRLADVVSDSDRIEIYRPLIADPKAVRRMRAEKAVQEGRADKVTGGRPNTVRK